MAIARPGGVSSHRQMVAREDALFPWFIGLALAAALVGGFRLAVLLPLAARRAVSAGQPRRHAHPAAPRWLPQPD